ncbi:RagB/SusD family nutrient uptake outer membrane protein [Olivibacter ginsenosidimutans]|uniref:RagB/SusD family nutrient uptake outer membrane protein n=1 Tax=Olivibacter ginsenosidimutans TaxID=1176537 RepID=A0ABP9ASE7_9SPHI
MMKRTTIYIIGLLLGVYLTSCSDYLDRNPLSGPSDDNYFNNVDELTLVVNGLYSALNYQPIDGMPNNLTIDDATDIGWDRNVSNLQSLGRGDHDSNNGYVVNVWTNAFKVIGKCNFILDNMNKLDGQMDATQYQEYQAEARFVRAYTYQYLVDYFGDVPLLQHGLSLEDNQIPRTAKAEVVTFILQELQEAADILPVTQAETGRATKGAALATRARAALHAGLWNEAIASAQAVMDLQTYSLHPNFGELFSYAGENSPEIIFALQYLRQSDTKTFNATNLISRNGKGTSNKIPSQSLVDAFLCTDGKEIDKSPLFNPAKPFENRDPRLGFTIALPGSEFFGYQFETHKDSVQCWDYTVTPARRIPNQDATNAYATFSGYLWRKYVDIQDADQPSKSELNVTQIRYAEVLLIYAEAKIEANQIDASVYEALNAIRQRPSVDMPAIESGKSQSELRQLVRKERLYELAMEGFRMVDLRRWQLADKFMNSKLYGRIPRGLLATAPTIDADGKVDYSQVPNVADMRIIENRKFNASRDYLWPIPNVDIITDPQLVQNPNY